MARGLLSLARRRSVAHHNEREVVERVVRVKTIKNGSKWRYMDTEHLIGEGK